MGQSITKGYFTCAEPWKLYTPAFFLYMPPAWAKYFKTLADCLESDLMQK
jgi:hypothetical protein